MKETTILIIGLLLPLLGTMIGSAFVFMMKNEMSTRLQKSLLGFASGVMVAASVWSLLIPAMEMKANSGAWSVVPASVGFLLGIGFLLLIDELTPHLHIGTDKPERRLALTLIKNNYACPCRNYTQSARRNGSRRCVCRSREWIYTYFVSCSHLCIFGYCHTKHSRRGHHLYAYACCRQ